MHPQDRWSLVSMGNETRQWQTSIFFKHVQVEHAHKLSFKHFILLDSSVHRGMIKYAVDRPYVQLNVLHECTFDVFKWLMDHVHFGLDTSVVHFCKHNALDKLGWLFDHGFNLQRGRYGFDTLPHRCFLAAAERGHVQVMRRLEQETATSRKDMYTSTITQHLPDVSIEYLARPIVNQYYMTTPTGIFRMCCKGRCERVLRKCLQQPPHSEWKGRRIDKLDRDWELCIRYGLYDIFRLGQVSMWKMLEDHYEFESRDGCASSSCRCVLL